MDDDTRPDCRYGSLCYQKNPDHLAKYRHSFKRKERNSDVESQNKKLKPGTSQKRLSNSSKTSNNQKNSKSPLFKTEEVGMSQTKESNSNKTTKDTKVSNKHSPKEKNNEESKRENFSKRNSGSYTKKNSTDNLDNRDRDECTKDSLEENKNSHEIAVTINLDESFKRNEDNIEVTETNISINRVLLDDVSEMKSIVKDKYLVQMPDEFFTLWKFCRKISPKCPKDAFKNVNIKLVGPFDIMNGEHLEDGIMVTHWRYFYDPPEFQTIMVSCSKEHLHFGYFRDSPDDDPVFIASNSNKDCKITPVASNLFMFLNEQIGTKLKSSDPFSQGKFSILQQKLSDFAQAHKIDLETPKLSSVVRGRKSKTVCKGLSGVGVVVPYEKKTELGYRPLQKSDKDLESLFRQYRDPSVDSQGRLTLKSMLEEVSNWVTIAMDESDFGTGLEFGLDLFGSGIPELHSMTLNTLGVAYQYLNRDEFNVILEAHLENRKKPYINLLEEN